MSTPVATINKFLVSLAGTITIASTALSDGDVTTQELTSIIASALTTVAVYLVPYATSGGG